VGKKPFFLFSVLTAAANSALLIACPKTTPAKKWMLLARRNRKTPWCLKHPARTNIRLLLDSLAELRVEFISALKSLSTWQLPRYLSWVLGCRMDFIQMFLGGLIGFSRLSLSRLF
jgi:hypothetical protein